MWPSIVSTTASRIDLVSANVRPSGATSRSWKREVWDAELREELEGGVELLGRGFERIAPDGVPRPIERAGPKDVRARPGERVPQADGDPEVVLHALAQHHPVGVVDLEGQRVRGVQAFEPDRPRHVGEERLAHPDPSSRTMPTCPRSLALGFVGATHKCHAGPGTLCVRQSRFRREGPRGGALEVDACLAVADPWRTDHPARFRCENASGSRGSQTSRSSLIVSTGLSSSMISVSA